MAVLDRIRAPRLRHEIRVVSHVRSSPASIKLRSVESVLVQSLHVSLVIEEPLLPLPARATVQVPPHLNAVRVAIVHEPLERRELVCEGMGGKRSNGI